MISFILFVNWISETKRVTSSGESIVLTLLIVLAVFALYLFIRNHEVYKYRMQLLKKISAKSHEDIKNHNYDFQWRFDELKKISYERMLFAFWIPINKFYDETKILGVKNVQ